MLYVVMGQLVVILYFIWAQLEMNGRAREERRELEDRLMAICQPVPLTQVTAVRESVPNEVKYVDEEPATARIGANNGAEA